MLLLDDELPNAQPTDLEFLDVETLDPASLDGELSDCQGADGECSHRGRAHGQRPDEARSSRPRRRPRERYLRHLERFELGTRYPVIIERVRQVLSTNPLRGKRIALLADKTGVGASVVDSLRYAGLGPIAITIHGGSVVSRDEYGYRVPKRDLVSAVQVLLQNSRLRIAEGLPLAETLKKELLNFRVKIDPKTAHDSYEHWREGDHDDLVLAAAMACWFRQWFNAHLDAANALAHR